MSARGQKTNRGQHSQRGRRREGGATAVEFALVGLFVFSLMLGLVDFARWLFAFNSAVEATRYGARIATVCSQNAVGVKSRMLPFLPPGSTAATNITVTYLSGAASGCAVGEVCAVEVRLTNITIPKFAWYLPGPLAIPAFATTLPRESLETVIGGVNNPVCL